MATVVLTINECIHESFVGEYKSRVKEDEYTLQFFASDIDGNQPMGFGIGEHEEDVYEKMFKEYTKDDPDAEEIWFGSGQSWESNGGETYMYEAIYLTPNGLRYELDDWEDEKGGYTEAKFQDLSIEELKQIAKDYDVEYAIEGVDEEDQAEMVSELWWALDYSN